MTDFGDFIPIFAVTNIDTMLNMLLSLSTLLSNPLLPVKASGSNRTGNDDNITCNLTTHNTSVLAYVDWPFRIDCEHLTNIWKAKSPSSNDVLECRLHRNGVRHNSTIFTVSNFNENTIFVAELYVNKTRCLTSYVQVDLSHFPNETCQISRDDRTRMIDQDGIMDNELTLHCGISNDEYPEVIPKGPNMADFKTVWITENCEDTAYRGNNGWRDVDGPEGFGKTLYMRRVDYHDGVNFTCSVTYKGMTLYPVSYQICVQQQTLIEQDPSLKCRKSYSVVRNGYIEFDCDGQLMGSITRPGDFTMLWKKGNEVICENQNFNKKAVGSDNRVSCNVTDKTGNEPFHCVYYGGTSPYQDKRKKVKQFLSVRDVQSSDFGDYTVIFMVVQNGIWKNKTMPITLLENRSPYFQMLVKVLPSVLAIIIVLTVVALLVWRYRIYFLVFYKRSRLRKYDKDNKDYIAYLSYHFDNEDISDSARASAKYTETIVTAIHDYMESNNFHFYDEQRDANFGAEVEKVTNLVEKCHRMILILTTMYLKDKWLRFQAELGFYAQLESGLGVVIIATPGAVKLLSKMAKKDKVWGRLEILLKTNRVIKWTDGMSDDVLKKHVEYGMPKLKRKDVP